MTSVPPSPPPPVTNAAGEPLDPTVDLVPIAARGMLVGFLLGTALVAVVLFFVRVLLAGAPASDRPVATGPAFPLLVLGVLAAMAVAGATTWFRLAAVGSFYRRSMLATVTAIATVLSALLAAPLHYFLGQPGLVGLAVLALGGAALVARRR